MLEEAPQLPQVPVEQTSVPQARAGSGPQQQAPANQEADSVDARAGTATAEDRCAFTEDVLSRICHAREFTEPVASNLLYQVSHRIKKSAWDIVGQVVFKSNCEAL